MAELLGNDFAVANFDIDAEPAAVATCRSTADVVAAVRLAVASGSPVAVRGGGYSPAGLGTVAGGTVIDVEPLSGISVDPASRTVSVGAGARTGSVDNELHRFGLALTLPVIGRPGVVGAALSAGVGHLVRKLGFTCDAIVSATVVTAEGGVVDAGAPEHADLLWALRGGGGNFGVVTELVLQAHELNDVSVGMYAFPIEAAADELRFYRDWSGDTSDDVVAVTMLRTMPPMPGAPPEHVGRPVLTVATVHTGSETSAERELAPLAARTSLVFRHEARIALSQLRAMSNASFPHARFGVFTRSGWGDVLNDDVNAAAVEASFEMPPGESVLEFVRMQGAVARADLTTSPLPDRDAAFFLNTMGLWLDPAEGDAVRGWVLETDERLRPMRRSAAVAPGFVAADELGLAEATYGPAYQRLREIKRRYDPHNVFARNLNVKP
jgi:FAD/FMN-containing dehydrogenase